MRYPVLYTTCIFTLLTACQGPDDNNNAPQTSNPTPATSSSSSSSGSNSGNSAPGVPYGGALALNLTTTPSVQWSAVNGKTTVTVQYAVRGDQDQPLADTDYTTTLLLNDKPLDVESLVDRSAQEVAVNLDFAMVLDATYSMTQHNPPAFEPMKKAARNSWQNVIDIWAKRSGKLNVSFMWFDEFVNQAVDLPAASRQWQPDDALFLPTPPTGTATRLYGAVAKMADTMAAHYQSKQFAGDRDQQIMLVFSDGANNYSYFDNSSISRQLTTSNGASYLQTGTPASTLDDVKAKIAADPKLIVHVIGLGSAINADELAAIAKAGKGLFLQNPSSQNLEQLFQRVIQEFTTIQTQSAVIPLAPGDYNFTIKIANRTGTAADEYHFNFHAGDTTAHVL